MNEYWYQVICDGEEDGGEFFGSTAQECADYVRQRYTGYKADKIIKDFEIVSILRVEKE